MTINDKGAVTGTLADGDHRQAEQRALGDGQVTGSVAAVSPGVPGGSG